ncbi:MAG: division/cell wall cluster transcriptional repressor MraZ [Bacteroidota bacterium]
MSSFKGSFSHTVDAKSRVNIPAKLRKNLSREAKDTFIVTRGFESCLFLYPQDEWMKLELTIRNLSSTNPQHRFMMRTLLECATEVELDGQSRVMLPKELLQFAKIESEVRMIGVLDRIEIWNPNIYEKYKSEQKESYEDVASKIILSSNPS